MYYSYEEYVYYMEQRLHALEQEQEKLASENKKLKEKLEEIKPVHIENINYKIQELVVKELKGTLNIGLTALTDPEQIKQLLAEQEQEEDVHIHDVDQSVDPNEQ